MPESQPIPTMIAIDVQWEVYCLEAMRIASFMVFYPYRGWLTNYGPVHCRLRSVTIEKRTSFLETNSYRFVKDHSIFPAIIYRLATRRAGASAQSCSCETRRPSFNGQTESDWQAFLIHSDGQNRKNDNFVEAHIYEGFDRNAIESLVPSPARS